MSRPLAAAFFLSLAGAAASAQAPHPCGDSYTVVAGDTLYSIARRCRSTVAAIAAASGLADPARIEIGQRLVIPRRGLPPPPAPDKEDGAPEQGGAGYRIVAGDTLYSLARWSRVSLRALMAANPGVDPHKIEIGDLVRLPAGAADPARARRRERGPGRPAPREDRPRGDEPERQADGKPEPEPEGM